MEKGMNLSGQLGDWSVDDLIQIVQVTKKTGSLDIAGGRKGRIHFRDGLLTGAELHSPRGIYAGDDPDTIADIVFVLGSQETGSFAMGASTGPESDGHEAETIAASVAELRALETEISGAGVMDGDIRLVSSVDAKITLDPNSWHYLARLIPPVTIDDLEERFGRGSAIRMIFSLHSMGLLATPPDDDDEASGPAPSVDESGWLEQLAGGVAPTEKKESSDEVLVEIEIPDSSPEPVAAPHLRGVSADASTTLTGGVYDDIRRLRSKVGE